MAHGDKDARVGSGQVIYGSIRQPTLSIPCDCSCTWIVVQAGPGLKAVSEAKYLNALCKYRHVPSLVPMPDMLRMVSGDD